MAAYDETATPSSMIWRPLHRLPRYVLPAELRSWICEQKSLTQRLKRSCRGRFQIQLEGQIWERPMIDEAQVLGLRPGACALIRQVYLLCEGRPRIYARTVIPSFTLRAERRLASLGSRPLGDLLFGDATISRDHLQAAQIPAHHPLFRLATRKHPINAKALWGRRSIFCLRGKPLLVVEIFFPDV